MVPPDEVKAGFRGSRPKLRGDANVKPRPHQPAPADGKPPEAKKQRVLFVCLGNSCRSQMAEAFARAYGSDVMSVQSAGLTPAVMISPRTKQVLAEMNLNIDSHFPKGLEIAQVEPFDVVINMSGHPVDLQNTRIVPWLVQDPIGQSEEVYRNVRQQIEGLVMELILELRAGRLP